MFQYQGCQTYVESLDLVSLTLLVRSTRTCSRVDSGLLWALLWLLCLVPGIQAYLCIPWSLEAFEIVPSTYSPSEDPPE